MVQLYFKKSERYDARMTARVKKSAKQNDEKSSDQLRVRIPEALKVALAAAISDHPHFRGNMSLFMLESAKAIVLQKRRGKKVAFPLEFVEE
jgi:hypothetical protein